LTISDNKAVVDWKSTAMACRPTVDREQHRRGIVVDLDRARREIEWKSAPEY
jgi:hypothetical protein